MELPFDIQTARPNQISRYRELVGKGMSSRLAEMLALQQPPGTRGTDRAFLEGRQNNEQLDSLPKLQAQYMVREAKKAGISVAGKFYCAGIADKRGWKDPAAWVTSGDDVLKVAKKRDLHLSGAVEYTPPDRPAKRTVLAESIIQDELKKQKKLNPKAKVGELREKIIEKHAYKVKGRL
jgi:hypothetical protein